MDKLSLWRSYIPSFLHSLFLCIEYKRKKKWILTNRDKEYDHYGFSGEREQQNSDLRELWGQGKGFEFFCLQLVLEQYMSGETEDPEELNEIIPRWQDKILHADGGVGFNKP